MKQYFAFTRLNFILLAVAMAVVVVGMILMSGEGSTKEAFNPDIFSATRIKVAPLICLLGYVLMVVAIMFPSKRRQEIDDEPVAESKPTKIVASMLGKGNAQKGLTHAAKTQVGKNMRRQEIEDEPTKQTKSLPMFSRPFSFKGRIRRTEFVISLIVVGILNIFLNIWVDSSEMNVFSAIIIILISITALWFYWAQMCKRFHDNGITGWMFFALLVPILNIYIMIMLIFFDGNKGDNEYGADPKGRTQTTKDVNNNIKRR